MTKGIHFTVGHYFELIDQLNNYNFLILFLNSSKSIKARIISKWYKIKNKLEYEVNTVLPLIRLKKDWYVVLYKKPRVISIPLSVFLAGFKQEFFISKFKQIPDKVVCDCILYLEDTVLKFKTNDEEYKKRVDLDSEEIDITCNLFYRALMYASNFSVWTCPIITSKKRELIPMDIFYNDHLEIIHTFNK